MGDYYNEHFVKLYTIFMAQLQGILPPGTDIPAAYAGGTDDEQVRNRSDMRTDPYCPEIGNRTRSPSWPTTLFGQQAKTTSSLFCADLVKPGGSSRSSFTIYWRAVLKHNLVVLKGLSFDLTVGAEIDSR